MKTRADLFDQDYLNKLNKKELEWLNKFNKESINASFNETGNLHKTKKLKKSCYDKNNARNRDILTRAKASNQLIDYEELYEETNNNNYEDYLVEELDKKDILEALSWMENELGKADGSLEDKFTDDLEEKELPSRKK